jgi:hypothetical protein
MTYTNPPEGPNQSPEKKRRYLTAEKRRPNLFQPRPHILCRPAKAAPYIFRLPGLQGENMTTH